MRQRSSGDSSDAADFDGKRIQIRQNAVGEKVRKRGIGRMMVKYPEDFARKPGFREMTLHAREAVVPFYELPGYAKVGDRFTEVTIPHRAMVTGLVGGADPWLRRMPLRESRSRKSLDGAQ